VKTIKTLFSKDAKSNKRDSIEIHVLLILEEINRGSQLDN